MTTKLLRVPIKVSVQPRRYRRFITAKASEKKYEKVVKMTLIKYGIAGMYPQIEDNPSAIIGKSRPRRRIILENCPPQARAMANPNKTQNKRSIGHIPPFS
jgi:hypothetical protein